MFRRVLVCTDFKDSLYRLAGCIQGFAIAGIRQVVFLHGVPFVETTRGPKVDQKQVEETQDRLTQALKQVPEGMEVKVEVQSGDLVETILKVSSTYSSDVIILGTQSRTLLTEKLFGSTLVELSQRSRIPLFVLRPQLISCYRTEELELRCQHFFDYLLLPYDDSESAKYTLEQLKLYLTKDPNPGLKRCLLCRVVKADSSRDIFKGCSVTEAESSLLAVKSDLETFGLQVETRVLQGDPMREILAVAEVEDISAIALSSGPLSRLLDWAVPSFASELLRQSWHPVLFFPSKQ